MKLSMRSDYGIRALVDLAQRYGTPSVRSCEIAERQGVDEQYLDQVLNALRKGGLVKSVRGPRGGHSLARPPEAITIAEVVTILDGSIVPLNCLVDSSSCDRSFHCAQQEVWREVASSIQSYLTGVTIAQLAGRQARLENREAYAI
ncbi:MAG: RrF2 family transcriptional regulator [Chloroflexi bacterium]|nr:RrF2 family transcriptional regulator [Chloroflexota bacterium]